MIEDLIDRHLSQPEASELCPDCHTPIATCDCEKTERTPMPNPKRYQELNDDIDYIHQHASESHYQRHNTPELIDERGYKFFFNCDFEACQQAIANINRLAEELAQL